MKTSLLYIYTVSYVMSFDVVKKAGTTTAKISSKVNIAITTNVTDLNLIGDEEVNKFFQPLIYQTVGDDIENANATFEVKKVKFATEALTKTNFIV